MEEPRKFVWRESVLEGEEDKQAIEQMEDNEAVLRKESMVEPRKNERSRCSRRTILWAQLFLVCLSLAVAEVKCKNVSLFDLDDTLNAENVEWQLRYEDDELAKVAKTHQEALYKLLSDESMVSNGLPVFVLTSRNVLDDASRKRYIADTFGVMEDVIKKFEDLSIELHGEQQGEVWKDPCQVHGSNPIRGLKIESGLPIPLLNSSVPRDIYITSSNDVYGSDGKDIMKLRLLEIGLHYALIIGENDEEIRLITVGDRWYDLVVQELNPGSELNSLWWPDDLRYFVKMDNEDGQLLKEMKDNCPVSIGKFKLYTTNRNIILEGIGMPATKSAEAKGQVKRRFKGNGSADVHSVSEDSEKPGMQGKETPKSRPNSLDLKQVGETSRIKTLEVKEMKEQITVSLQKVAVALERTKERWDQGNWDCPRRICPI
eukprot:GHVS01034626.1.p1 GENE.GHVS01034626.1~~GHVS01034626.1.p1  ORF type:complete len:430 (+),score=44.99 GHVS01034626.1:133-1422(+)